METLKKANIGGFVFTLENKAASMIEDYLNMLAAHYEGRENGTEIIEGIESRLAEILMDRAGEARLVTESDARMCIDILGSPEEIYEDEEGREEASGRKEPIRKRLFRDPEDKELAGVFGGLGAYFGIDPVFLRIPFLALWIVSMFTCKSMWNPFVITLVYCALWLCIPKAETTLQKYAMRGEAMSVGKIERQVKSGRGSSGRASVLGTLFKIFLFFVGFVILLVGLAGLIALFAGFIGLSVAGIALPGFLEGAMSLLIDGPEWLLIMWKTTGILILLLPFIGFVYVGIKMVFSLKAPIWKPGLCCFLLWVVAVMMFLGISGAQMTGYSSPDWQREKEDVCISGDTLHVRFAGIEEWKGKHILAKGDSRSYSLMYYGLDKEVKDSNLFEIAIYPRLYLRQTSDSASAPFALIKTKTFNSTRTMEELESGEEKMMIDTDTLVLYPSVARTGHSLRDLGTDIELFLPIGTNVVVDAPVEHHFDKEFNCSDLDVDSRKVIGIISEIL